MKVFRYDSGVLSDQISIAPQNGFGFRARHLDFHPTRPWVFLTLESQNRLQVYRRTDDGLETTPLFSVSTLSAGRGHTRADSQHGPRAPERTVRLCRQPGTPAGGRNEIAVFRINEATGEPSLIQNVDSHGFTPRTFALDPPATCSSSATRVPCRSAKATR